MQLDSNHQRIEKYTIINPHGVFFFSFFKKRTIHDNKCSTVLNTMLNWLANLVATSDRSFSNRKCLWNYNKKQKWDFQLPDQISLHSACFFVYRLKVTERKTVQCIQVITWTIKYKHALNIPSRAYLTFSWLTENFHLYLAFPPHLTEDKENYYVQPFTILVCQEGTFLGTIANLVTRFSFFAVKGHTITFHHTNSTHKMLNSCTCIQITQATNIQYSDINPNRYLEHQFNYPIVGDKLKSCLPPLKKRSFTFNKIKHFSHILPCTT